MQRLSSFPSDVLNVVLTGLNAGTAAAVSAADSVLSAFGKLQATIVTLAPRAAPTFTGLVTYQGMQAIPAATGIAAAGTTLAAGTQLTKSYNVVSTATTGTAVAVKLADQAPVAGTAVAMFVYNATTVAISVFPPTATQIINKLAAGATFSLAANTGVTFTQVSATQWWTG